MRVMRAQRKSAKSKFKKLSKVGFMKLQISRDLRQKTSKRWHESVKTEHLRERKIEEQEKAWKREKARNSENYSGKLKGWNVHLIRGRSSGCGKRN